MRNRYTAEQRERLIAEVRASGDSAGAVAKRMGVTPSTAYLWIRQASKPDSPVFAQVVPTSSTLARARLIVEVGAAAIRVESGFDAELLAGVVAALRRAK